MAANSNALEVERLTQSGLLFTFIGWALLLGGATVSDLLVKKSPRQLPSTFHADLIEIAKNIIISGFNIAIIEALQSGFGA